jgi:hypothetical protein
LGSSEIEGGNREEGDPCCWQVAYHPEQGITSDHRGGRDPNPPDVQWGETEVPGIQADDYLNNEPPPGWKVVSAKVLPQVGAGTMAVTRVSLISDIKMPFLPYPASRREKREVYSIQNGISNKKRPIIGGIWIKSL